MSKKNEENVIKVTVNDYFPDFSEHGADEYKKSIRSLSNR